MSWQVLFDGRPAYVATESQGRDAEDFAADVELLTGKTAIFFHDELYFDRHPVPLAPSEPYVRASVDAELPLTITHLHTDQDVDPKRHWIYTSSNRAGEPIG